MPRSRSLKQLQRRPLENDPNPFAEQPTDFSLVTGEPSKGIVTRTLRKTIDDTEGALKSLVGGAIGGAIGGALNKGGGAGATGTSTPSGASGVTGSLAGPKAPAPTPTPTPTGTRVGSGHSLPASAAGPGGLRPSAQSVNQAKFAPAGSSVPPGASLSQRAAGFSRDILQGKGTRSQQLGASLAQGKIPSGEIERGLDAGAKLLRNLRKKRSLIGNVF
jgi:hypothetical protein